MSPQTAVIKLRLRLNKSHSSDYDNIQDYAAVEAINKAAKEWARRTVYGLNQEQAGAEETRQRIDDIQFLLKPYKLGGRNHKNYFDSNLFPDDYLAYSRIIPYAFNETCSDIPLKSYLKEEANIPTLLADWSWQPDIEWRQSLHTIQGNKIRVYTDDFKINDIDLIYYRFPKEMDIEGYTHETGRDSTNVDLEFKDDIAEIIIDEAASIIAGDIESVNAVELTKQRATQNT
jgi:hypothetical protein